MAGQAEAREATLGIRTLTREPDMSYWLNGKHIFLKGVWYPMENYYSTKTRVQSTGLDCCCCEPPTQTTCWIRRLSGPASTIFAMNWG